MPITLNGDGSISGLTNTGISAAQTVTTAAITDASVTPAKLSQPLTVGTSVATTSGSSVTFTNIPSWVKRVTVIPYTVSSNGTSHIQVRLGSGGTLLTSGYTGYSSIVYTGVAIQRDTDGFPIYYDTNTFQLSGNLVFTNPTGNLWVCSGVGTSSGGSPTFTWNTGGFVTLSGQLNIIGIVTQNGTDTFDNGSVNIIYE
jgi:hypothetical protein